MTLTPLDLTLYLSLCFFISACILEVRNNMKLTNNVKKKQFQVVDDQCEDSEEPQKWYEHVFIKMFIIQSTPIIF